MSREDTATENDTVYIEGGDDAELDILNELNASPDDVTWKMSVSRVMGAAKDGAKEPFLFEGDASVMEGLHTRLRDEYGSGIYRVRVMRNRRLYRRFDISVEAPQKKSEPVKQSSELTGVLAAFQAANDRTIALLERLTERTAPIAAPVIPSDPFDMMAKMVTAMSGLRAMMVPAEATSATDMILKGVELRDKLVGNGGGDDDGEVSLMGLIKTALQSPLVQQIVNAQTAPVPIRQEVLMPLPSSNPKIIAPAPQIIASDPITETAMKQAFGYLNGKAKKGSDVGFYADWVADNWPPELITLFLNQPNPMQLIVNFAPEATPNAAWFQGLIDELRKLVKTAPSNEPQPANDVSRQHTTASNINGNPGRGSGSEGDVTDDDGASEKW